MSIRATAATALFAAAVLAVPSSAGAQEIHLAASRELAPSALPATRIVETGRRYAEWFLAGRIDSVWAYANTEMRRRFGSAEALGELRTQLDRQAGQEIGVIKEAATTRLGRPQYWRESSFEFVPGEPVVIRVVLDGAGRLAGLGIGPKSQAQRD